MRDGVGENAARAEDAPGVLVVDSTPADAPAHASAFEPCLPNAVMEIECRSITAEPGQASSSGVDLQGDPPLSRSASSRQRTLAQQLSARRRASGTHMLPDGTSFADDDERPRCRICLECAFV